MKLFGGKGQKPNFADYDTRQRVRRVQSAVVRANTVRKKSFEALIGKPKGPVFASELKASQTFASFKKMDEGVKKGGLGKFFKRPRDYAKGESE